MIWELEQQSVHYENGLLQCSNVDRKKVREGRGQWGERGQTEENVWARRNDATKKYAMRAEREREREREGSKIDRIQS